MVRMESDLDQHPGLIYIQVYETEAKFAAAAVDSQRVRADASLLKTEMADVKSALALASNQLTAERSAGALLSLQSIFRIHLIMHLVWQGTI